MPLSTDYQTSEPDLLTRPEPEPEPKPDKPTVDLNTTRFKLPADWTVEVRPRGGSSSKHSDRYYHEPGTGRKFRSLLSVKRHLTGEEESPPRKKQGDRREVTPPHQNSGTVKKVIYGGKVLSADELEAAHDTQLEDIYPETLRLKSASILPDGWIVKDVPRKLGSKIKSDRYYIEPATGKRFRSLPEVHRYLEGERYEPKSKASPKSGKASPKSGKASATSGKTSPMSGCSTAPRSPLPRRKNTSIKMFNDSVFDLMNPPETVNWVYSGDGNDSWSPLVEECMIPNYVKEQWAETFLLGMNRRKHCDLQFTVESNL